MTSPLHTVEELKMHKPRRNNQQEHQALLQEHHPSAQTKEMSGTQMQEIRGADIQDRNQ